MLILLAIEVNNGTSLTYPPFLKAQDHATQNILLSIEHLSGINDVSQFAL